METNKTTPNSLINTLGQSETIIKNREQIALSGSGISLSNKTKLKLRTRRKQKTQAIALSIINVMQDEHNPAKENAIWNMYYCQSKLHSIGNQVFGTYCKNRLCNVCSTIRQGEIVRDYQPLIQDWKNPYHVTLTVKSCTKYDLKLTIEKMTQTFSKIKNKHRKRNQRGKGQVFRGIRILECGFKLETETYNPHFHLIVSNKETAQLLINDWLNILNNDTRPEHQDMQKIETENGILKTLFYITKGFNHWYSDIEDGSEDIVGHTLNNIFDALKGKRIFERFGFNTSKIEKPKCKAIILNDAKRWEYNSKISDWENEDGELLSNS